MCHWTWITKKLWIYATVFVLFFNILENENVNQLLPQLLDSDTLLKSFHSRKTNCQRVRNSCVGVTLIPSDGEHTCCLFMSSQLKTWIQHGLWNETWQLPGSPAITSPHFHRPRSRPGAKIGFKGHFINVWTLVFAGRKLL